MNRLDATGPGPGEESRMRHPDRFPLRLLAVPVLAFASRSLASTPPVVAPDAISEICDPSTGLPMPAIPTMFDPASAPAADIETLSWLLLGICAAIFVVVQGALVHAILKYRAAKNAAPAEGDAEPRQVYGSNPVELAWTVIPIVIVFVLTLTSVRLIREIEISSPPDGALKVVDIGHQWWWEYRYPDYGIVTANELVVPAGRPIWLELHSADVNHSWWVPQLAGKMDCIPGHPNNLWFEADRPGVYLGQCAEYCGNQHANMLLRVEARETDGPLGFDAWVANQQQPPVDDESTRRGKEVFLAFACQSCHDIAGVSDGAFGPNLTHLMSRVTIGAGVAPLDRNTLRQWVNDPQSLKPGCNMPALKLDDAQLDAVVDYLASLR
jgi:cytochrome c oxidase subunit 2